MRIEHGVQALGKAVAGPEPIQLREIDSARRQLDAQDQIVAALGNATHVGVALVQDRILAHDAQTFEAVTGENQPAARAGVGDDQRGASQRKIFDLRLDHSQRRVARRRS